MPRVFANRTIGDSHLQVALVTRGFADLLVHRVATWGQARNESRWYMCRNKQDAELYLHFTSPGMANLKVCWVDTFGEAGWVWRHPLRGELEALCLGREQD